MQHPISTHDPRLAQAVESISRAVSKSKFENEQEVEALLGQFEDMDELLKRCSAPGLNALCGLGTSLTRLLAEDRQVGRKDLRALLVELVKYLHANLVDESEKQSAEDIVRAAMEAVNSQNLRLTVQTGRLLGEVLMAMSMLDAEAVEQALELQRKTGVMFGKALIELGKLTPETLETALRVQAQRRARQMSDPTSGRPEYGKTPPLPR